MAKVFISYAHEDEGWKDRVVSHLGALANEGLQSWDDRRIEAGGDWEKEIEQAIADSDVALLLISRHFLNSRFILGNEVPALLQRREQQGLRVIPVILSPCQWTRIGWLKVIQARPKDGKPLSGMSEHEAEEALSALTGEIADLHPGEPRETPSRAPRVDLAHLPAGASHFLGREPELAQLRAAWASQGQTAIVECIAPGGTGKTALAKRWLDELRQAGWLGATRVYAWSFYSQGTTDDRQASEDGFLAAALDWFGVRIEASRNPADKGRKLAEAIAARRTLLVLDGLEPLQHPPGPMAGILRAPGVQALLTHLASAGHSGLVLLTSREWLTDLDEWAGTAPGRAEGRDAPLLPLQGGGREGDGVGYDRAAPHPLPNPPLEGEGAGDAATRTEAPETPRPTVLRLDLGNLNDQDGARLLHALGVKHAGAAAIDADDAELQAVSRKVQGHALTLSLLGRYLTEFHQGDIRRHKQVNFQAADRETKNGHAFRVMRAYETWFENVGGAAGARQLAALRLLAFFDRPAASELLTALRQPPAIEHVSVALQDLDEPAWTATLHRLQMLGLVFPPSPSGRGAGGEGGVEAATLDAHPLLREYLAQDLQSRHPESWREGHRRLYDYLTTHTPHQPDTLNDLQPLYQAVAHGCKAGLWQEALDQVYIDRILRGTGKGGFYSTRKLGAYSADLGAVACFFPQPWRQLAPALNEADQAWLLNQAAMRLRALGRLEEAEEPMRVSGEMDVKQEEWKGAAISYSNLSELQLSLGRVAAAVAEAERAVDYADRSGDASLRMIFRTTLADARQQHEASFEAAARLFAEAESMQAEDQPEYPRLYSLRGFQYCDGLLIEAERAAWRAFAADGVDATVVGASNVGWADARKPNKPTQDAVVLGFVPQPNLREVAERAAQTLDWEQGRLLDIALDHLTLARCALYTHLLSGAPDALAAAQAQAEQAVAGLRAATAQEFIPRGLLTRAWLHIIQAQPNAARADLAEAERIARRGAMRLHLADFHLHHARLFPEDHAHHHLAQARALIEQCEYFRRLPELEAAEAALGVGA